MQTVAEITQLNTVPHVIDRAKIDLLAAIYDLSPKVSIDTAKRERWRNNPEIYARERLKLDLTPQQIEILQSVLNNRRTAVKAHHSLGKTFIAAVALLWWLDCWDAHIGYVTAPTWNQVLGLTFKQAKRLAIFNKLEFDILDSGLIRDRGKFKQTERFIKALNAENGEGFQGEHTAPVLIVIEEAIGVPGYIFDAAEGLMTHPDCRILEIFNPTDGTAKAAEHCESPAYRVLGYSALDHPNIEAELHCRPAPFEQAVRLQWLLEMLEKEAEVVQQPSVDCFEFYSIDIIRAAVNGTPISDRSVKTWYKPTAFFQGRVLGEFPTEASDKIIPLSWLKALPILEINKNHRIQIGCDVARFGDDRTTIFARIGSIALSGVELRQFDSIAIANAIERTAKDTVIRLGLATDVAFKIPIAIDVTGGLGAGPYDILKQRGYNVIAVNSSESARDSELYKNKRSELWFIIRDRAKDKNLDLSRLDLDFRRRLEKELATPTYKILGGKKVAQDKSDTKKHLGASPDLADGFNLAFYEQPPTSGSGMMEFWV